MKIGKFKNLKFENSQKGVSLIIVFFMMMIILAVVLSISIILYSQIKVIRNIGDSVVAFYIADSGIEKTLYYDRKIIPEDGKRGICYMCNSDNPNKDPDCKSITPPADDPAGCDSLTCENCEINFNSTLAGGKKYEVRAVVSQESAVDDPQNIFSMLRIDSTGSYTHAIGADAVKRKIEITFGKQVEAPPLPELTVTAAAAPNPASIGQNVNFIASASGGTGTYSYAFTGDCRGNCDNTNQSCQCSTAFTSSANYVAYVEVTSGNKTINREISVFVRPWVCGDNLVDTRDGQSYGTKLIVGRCWMTKNMNIGTRIDGSINQGTNCPSAAEIEKYCYLDSNGNCDNKYGGLYQWNQAMCGLSGQTVQGICPAGWRIPKDSEFYTLENLYAMNNIPKQTCVGIRTGYDCNPAGTKLKPGDTSGFNGLLAGYRSVSIHPVSGNYFYGENIYAYFWSSLQAVPGKAYLRSLDSGHTTVYRDVNWQGVGYSVRCIKGP